MIGHAASQAHMNGDCWPSNCEACSVEDAHAANETPTIADFELEGSLAGTAYVNADVDRAHSTIELQVGRGFRSLTFDQAEALGVWLIEATS